MTVSTKKLVNPSIDKRVIPLWYAVYTRSRHEKKVAEQLKERHVEYYLPSIPRLRQWKDRKKMVEMPLFPGYLFVNIKLANRLLVLTADGVVRLLGFNGELTPIPEYQIENIRRLLSQPELIEIEFYIEEGDWVEIIYGPFSGVFGKLVQLHGKRRLLVGIDLIHQAVSVEVDMSWVRKVETPTAKVSK